MGLRQNFDVPARNGQVSAFDEFCDRCRSVIRADVTLSTLLPGGSFIICDGCAAKRRREIDNEATMVAKARALVGELKGVDWGGKTGKKLRELFGLTERICEELEKR